MAEKMRHQNRKPKRQHNKDKHEERVERGNKQLAEERVSKDKPLPPVQALNKKQKQYLNMLQTCNIVVVTGLFGTGKTYLAAVTAADALRKKEIDKVIVARPYVQTGRTSGFKKGSSLEKLFPYVRTILDTMKKRLGDGAYHYALQDGINGQIEVQEVESIRGRSFDERSYLILDEAQQTVPDEMLSIVTRISDDCTLVLCGDDSQKDIRGKSGLAWFKGFAEKHQLSGVGFIDFGEPEDIVRGGTVKEIAMAIAKDGRGF